MLTVLQEGSLDYARDDDGAKRYQNSAVLRETLIQSLSDFILGFFIQSEETFDENSELFKENVDDTMYKNPYEI